MQREINPGGEGLISPGKLSDIDWAGMWHRQMDAATFRGQGAAFWDNWVRSLPAKAEHSGYVGELMSRLRLSQGYSVLDVGAGTGALSIPIARRVARVTALDQSPAMLVKIMDDARNAGLSNIVTLHLDWNKAKVGEDFPRHDVVLVSRSLPTGENIADSLRSIDAAAEHLCYVTWKANGYDELEAELSTLLGIAYVPFPDYAVIYNLLLSLGIHANVELFKTNGRRRYASIEEAYVQIVRSQPIDGALKNKIMDFLYRRLEHKNGGYYQQKNSLWALIWWDKDLA